MLNKEILRLSLPSILANITIPLVGLVDVAIAGHISDATAIGGIAIGSMLFDLLYWNFGFLRVGTGGMTAQAYGRGDMHQAADIFRRSISIALRSAFVIWLLQYLFLWIAMLCIPCSEGVATFARSYFYIRVWAAPATLSLFAFKGWFIGMQNTIAPMMCDLVVNAVNILASYLLAIYTPLGAQGVAWGTLIAQYAGLFTAIYLLHRGILAKKFPVHIHFSDLPKWLIPHRDKTPKDTTAHSLYTLNTQIFIRSLCFMVVYVGFTSLTSLYGDTPLALGSITMKFCMFFSYFIDGFAYAGEAMTGRYIGANDRLKLRTTVRLLLLWGLFFGLFFTALYGFYGEELVGLMTNDTTLIAAFSPYLIWLTTMPLVSCFAFIWDGIFVGATAGKHIMNCMIAAAIGFVLAYLLFADSLGLHAVFLAYFVHLVARTVYLTLVWPSTLRASFEPQHP